MLKEVFQTLELYPELKEVKNSFKEIKEEAFSLKTKMFPLNDYRVSTNVWNIFPLLPEKEDRGLFSDEVWKKNQLLAPKTSKILSSIASVEAYMFSSLEPKGHIGLHKHENPFVTAALCLQDGGDSCIIVNGIKAPFRTGEVLIFDYTQDHEVFNHGIQDRIVLLMLLKNRK